MKKLSLMLLPLVVLLSVVGAMVWPAEPVAAACPAGQHPGDRALGQDSWYCYSSPVSACPDGQSRGTGNRLTGGPDYNKCYERDSSSAGNIPSFNERGDAQQPERHGPVDHSGTNPGGNTGGDGNSGGGGGGNAGDSGGSGAPAGGSSGECGDVKVAFLSCDVNTDPDADAVERSALWAILQMVLNIMIGLVGIAAVGGLVYAAIIYASAQDNASQVQQAKDTIRNVVIGVVMFVFMWAALQYLIPGGIF